jgi:hypothetical protein
MVKKVILGTCFPKAGHAAATLGQDKGNALIGMTDDERRA